MRVGEHIFSVGRLALLAVLLVSVTACGGGTPPAAEAPAATPAPAAPPAPPPGPRVFFVQPQAGATVKSPVHFEFGAENFTISPVPAGTVEQARAGLGHHHLGVDADCLPVGEIIPKADPWVHFGTGNNTIDMQLTPGPHVFALQVGDDQHRTLPGLCTNISITVAP